ncbi:MAG: TolC family protein [Acidobacteriia bacterium]|nr:TolC family protein [Terriglobia bacterium]
MLKVTKETVGQEIRLKVEGKLAGPWLEEFRDCWLANSAVSRSQSLVVDLSGLTFIDAQGKELLGWIHQAGGRLVGTGLMTKSVIEEITGAGKPGGIRPSKAPIVKALALIVLPLLLFRTNLNAQEKPPLRLTLREAVQLVLKQNPQVQIANLDLAQSREDRVSARAALLPQIGFETYDKVQRFNLDAFIGHGFPGSPHHAGPFQTFQAGPGFSMPLFDLTLWRRLQAARQSVNATAAQEMGVREQIVLLVVSQYLGSLRAAANVRAAQSRVDLAQALYDQAADLQQHGVGTGLDTLRANVQLQNEKQRLIVAETQQATSLYGLARLLNVDPSQPLQLADQVSFFQTPEFGASQSLEQAYSTRPEMKTLAAREQIVLAQRKAAGDSRLPNILLNGSWGYQGLSLPSAIPAYQFQVTLDVPLFTGGKIHAETTKADLELKKVAQEVEEQRNQIALEVKTALAQLESARHEVDVANLGVKLAEEEVSQARDRFQAGVANNIEVVTAQDAFARANDNQIGALYRYNQSRADLAHATGQIESLYSK